MDGKRLTGNWLGLGGGRYGERRSSWFGRDSGDCRTSTLSRSIPPSISFAVRLVSKLDRLSVCLFVFGFLFMAQCVSTCIRNDFIYLLMRLEKVLERSRMHLLMMNRFKGRVNPLEGKVRRHPPTNIENATHYCSVCHRVHKSFLMRVGTSSTGVKRSQYDR